MTVTYLSPKLMEELKDRAIRVTVDPGGTLVWLRDAGEWFWLQPWQKPFVEKALRGEPLKLSVPRVRSSPAFAQFKAMFSPAVDEQPLDAAFDAMTAPRVSAPIQPMYDLTAQNRERRPIAETLAEPPEVRAERLETERLVVLGRLFERLSMDGRLIMVEGDGEPHLIGHARALPLSADEVEAVRGIG